MRVCAIAALLLTASSCFLGYLVECYEYFIFRNDTDPGWHEKLVTINEFLRTREFVIDIEPYFYDGAGMMNSELCIDGIHPDIKGKMLIGELINLNKDLFLK